MLRVWWKLSNFWPLSRVLVVWQLSWKKSGRFGTSWIGVESADDWRFVSLRHKCCMILWFLICDAFALVTHSVPANKISAQNQKIRVVFITKFLNLNCWSSTNFHNRCITRPLLLLCICAYIYQLCMCCFKCPVLLWESLLERTLPLNSLAPTFFFKISSQVFVANPAQYPQLFLSWSLFTAEHSLSEFCRSTSLAIFL